MDDNMVQSVITDRAGKRGQHECRLTEQDNAYTRSLLGFQPQRSSEVNSERTCADRRAHLWEAGEETSFCETSGEKEEPRLFWRTGWGAPLRGEPGQAGRIRVSEWNAWRPRTLGAFVEKWLGKMTQETEFDKTTAKEKSEWSGGDLMHWGPSGRWYCSWWGRQVAGGDSFQI